jgi:hypothetical protein
MRRLLPVFALVALAWIAPAPTLADTSLAPPGGDLVLVESEVTWPTAAQGTANEGGCLILNTTHDDVRVRINLSIEYADGSVSRLTNTGVPLVLEPEGGFILSVFFVIPSDAELGPASFVCEVHAMTTGGRVLLENVELQSPFEVVAP